MKVWSIMNEKKLSTREKLQIIYKTIRLITKTRCQNQWNNVQIMWENKIQSKFVYLAKYDSGLNVF